MRIRSSELSKRSVGRVSGQLAVMVLILGLMPLACKSQQSPPEAASAGDANPLLVCKKLPVSSDVTIDFDASERIGNGWHVYKHGKLTLKVASVCPTYFGFYSLPAITKAFEPGDLKQMLWYDDVEKVLLPGCYLVVMESRPPCLDLEQKTGTLEVSSNPTEEKD